MLVPGKWKLEASYVVSRVKGILGFGRKFFLTHNPLLHILNPFKGEFLSINPDIFLQGNDPKTGEEEGKDEKDIGALCIVLVCAGFLCGRVGSGQISVQAHQDHHPPRARLR